MLCFSLVVCAQEHELLSLCISGHHTLWDKSRVLKKEYNLEVKG